MITKGKYLNYMSCGLAHEMVACFSTFVLWRKKLQKNLPQLGNCSKYDITSHMFSYLEYNTLGRGCNDR